MTLIARCSPIIVAEMAEWTALGGSNLGCLGDANHTTGFHRAAFQVPPTDYSRRHDPGLPHAMEWACAGDFGHGRRPDLRARHAVVLRRLMTNDPALGMIDEFIGQPWGDQPVKYWARWHGTGTLRNYTGSGHTTWSHISWRRSRANERAYLWAPNRAEGTIVYTREDAIWEATFTGGPSCGPVDQVPTGYRGANDVHGNAEVSQLTYHTAMLKTLVDRPGAAVTMTPEDRAEIIAGVAAAVGPIAQAAAEAAVRAVLGSLDGATPPTAGG